MNIFFTVLAVIGGLSMYLYGAEVMSAGLKNASGSTLKKVLEKVTSNVVVGVLMGAIVTAVVQSSTATIVITVGLISAGVLNLKQAVSIVLGANIGTTITAQIIRLMDIDASGNFILNFFKPTTLAPLALFIGILFYMFLKVKNNKAVGEIFLGFGVLFSGIMSMTAAVEPLAESPMFEEIIRKFADMPVIGILTGFICTVIAQSSAAMVGMLQALSSTGVMTFSVVYPIIMGINIGTCVTTAIVCAIGSSKDAKRTGIAHIIFNVVGTIIFMIGMTLLEKFGAFPALWDKYVNSGDIANFQTLFNVITAVLLLPFTGLLVKTTYLLIKPDTKVEETNDIEIPTLDEKLFGLPQMAISEATSAIAVMGRLAHDNFDISVSQLENYSDDETTAINTRELKLDAICDTVENYLVRLSQNTLTEAQNETINLLIQTSSNFERIGDYATNINEFAQKIAEEDDISFSQSAAEELGCVFDAVNEIIDLTVDAFVNGNDKLATRVEPLEEVIDDMVQYLRDNHFNRLKSGDCTVTAGIIFLETLTYLEGASDQCSSIAVLQLARNNPQIRRNHHEYIQALHQEKEGAYAADLKARRDQYLEPLYAIKRNA